MFIARATTNLYTLNYFSHILCIFLLVRETGYCGNTHSHHKIDVYVLTRAIVYRILYI